ncbi:protein-tyrosine phosphatase [Actinoplanes lutulentus]|uniref:tyrosine-protein phosphatase n=1 Tax=Actinoplanes lutulentus TaxID=1287878 RepID=UPI000DBA0444|nr:tyrosine-protein phosphatase [Actinoplanes lutulentus]MBB2946768.1 protein-tyrosine phosphatase [Actinoplanes lutulentus]
MKLINKRLAATCAACAIALSSGLAAGISPAVAGGRHGDGHGVHQPATRHQIPFTAATVTQNADGSFTITWAATGARSVSVYAGTDQNRISYKRAVAKGSAKATVTVTGLAAADRWWFELVPDRGESLTVADRSLHLASAPNFRDAGGYRTAGGQWVRMGVLYRANDLGKLTDADVAKLKRLGIRTDIDFRTDSEITASPDRIPAGVTYIHANVIGTSGVGTGGIDLTTEAGGVAMMEAGEKAFVSSDSGRAAYTTFFTTVADPKAANVVYHCTAGKDRTGWASAALLTALGVPKATVLEDYLLSNVNLAASNAATLAAVPAAIRPGYKAVLDVRESYLQSGFDEVTVTYGTFDNYLRQGLGLTPKDLRALRAQLLVG